MNTQFIEYSLKCDHSQHIPDLQNHSFNYNYLNRVWETDVETDSTWYHHPQTDR